MRIRRLNAHNSGSMEGINVTPLIDVVMCLIIFFLIVGKLATERGMAVRLPPATSGHDEPGSQIIIVTIGKLPSDGGPSSAEPAPGTSNWASLGVIVQVDGQGVSDSKALELAAFARLNDQPGASLQIRADRDLTYGVVDPVLAALRAAGAKSVRFATERAR